MTSDLALLDELGASLAPAQDDPPAEVRHRVMNGMRQPVRRAGLLSRLGGARPAWKIAAAAAVAAALVAGQLSAGSRPSPPRHRGEAGAALQAPPAQHLPGARQVLLLAAQHAAAGPARDARPDQFVYIDSVEVESKIGAGGTATVSGPARTRTWLSVDGTRDGLVIQKTRTHLDGCTNGRRAQTIDRPRTSPQVACTPEPAYQPGRVPTDAARLLAYVYTVAAAEPRWVSVGTGPDRKPKGWVRLSADQRAFSEIAEILYKNHLPAVQAAAFEAAGRIPGVQMRRDVADAAGRRGVAVTRTEAGTREELVFDPVTYRYLGYNIIGADFDLNGAPVVSSPSSGKGTATLRLGPIPQPGEVIYESALLRIAIVDKAGQRP